MLADSAQQLMDRSLIAHAYLLDEPATQCHAMGPAWTLHPRDTVLLVRVCKTATGMCSCPQTGDGSTKGPALTRWSALVVL